MRTLRFTPDIPRHPFPGWKLGYQIRQLLLIGAGASIDGACFVKNRCYVGDCEGLKIGKNAQLSSHGRIGKYVSIVQNVLMGPEVVIMTIGHAFEDPDRPIQEQGSTELRPVRIGNDVWLGTRVIIMPGVTIGDGSVVGAGAIVTKDIPPLSVAAGNPAKVIRIRGSRNNTSTE